MLGEMFTNRIAWFVSFYLAYLAFKIVGVLLFIGGEIPGTECLFEVRLLEGRP